MGSTKKGRFKDAGKAPATFGGPFLQLSFFYPAFKGE
jgi:hypothetical protein